jgi:predicted nucleotidyltransferase
MTQKLRRTKKPESIQDVLHCLDEALPSLRDRYAVRRLAVFGSWARGEQQADSDVDVLVEFDRAPTIFGFMDLEEELSSLLSVPVDLVSRKSLRGKRGERILHEAVPL